MVARGWIVRHRADGLAVGVFVVLGLVVMGQYLPDPDGRVAAHLDIDNTWFEWLLAHGAYSVRHLSNPLFSFRQNAPDGVNMMANTSVLGVTLPLAPLTLLLGPKIVYVVWIVAATIATATTTYWALARHLVRSRAAAFAGAALAGFAPGVVNHASGQPNFVSHFLLPLIVVKVLTLGRPLRDGLVLALLVTWQVFINEEMLLITACTLAVTVIAYAWQRPQAARARLRPFAASLAVCAVIAAALCAYPLWMQFAGPQSYQALPDFHWWGEDIAAVVTLPRDSIGAFGVEPPFSRTEQNTWFGWALTIVAVLLAFLLRRTSVAARTAAVVALVLAFAALGPQIQINNEPTYVPGPWALISDRTPVLGLIMPSRLSYGVLGAVVVLVALGWEHAPRLSRFGRPIIVAALLPLLPVPIQTVPDPRPPHFITSGAWRPYVPPGTTLVPVPLPGLGLGRTTLTWSAAAHHEFPVPCGYFLGPDEHGVARMNPGARVTTVQLILDVIYTREVPTVTAATRAAVQADLTRWNAAVVVLAPQPAEAQLRSLLVDLLGPGERHSDVWLWTVR
ncbi:hypothetical protein JIG36_36330 [Actinoplanes sp. LDG1-06]|uniref:DUF6311 domain-containing protein n=1 Tax=Paractinoplanes ovalisporus TaxID=2810368 RepID=A0ABS2AMA0_9ACTN|nr:hypothetical protein [Actinoplanes ovalisporus]MBM2620982.1 hypothetical protein [Actinoplanes ovalisporus]